MLVSYRLETWFPSPVEARYLRIIVAEAHQNIALRAGLIVAPRDHKRSPFALIQPQPPTICTTSADSQRDQGGGADVGGGSGTGPVDDRGIANGQASAPLVGDSESSSAGPKAARWLARATFAQTAATTPAEPAPCASAQVSKAARWSARAARKPSPHAEPCPAPLLATDRVSAADEKTAQVAPIADVKQVPATAETDKLQPAGKAARWVSRAASLARHSEPQAPEKTSEEDKLKAAARHQAPTIACGGLALVIHAARYGSASDLWSVPCGGGRECGAKDVTDIIRQHIKDDELHFNPHRKPEYMNETLWPEGDIHDGSAGPKSGAVPRRLAVKYSYGSGAEVLIETPARPFEAVSLDIAAVVYVQLRDERFRYSGFVNHEGKPERRGEIQWPSMHGYTGMFRNGRPHGRGIHFYPDGSKFDGNFVDGCPDGDGVLKGGADMRPYDVVFASGGGLTIQDGAKPLTTEEANIETVGVARMPCISLSIGPPRTAGNKWMGNYPNLPAPDPSDNARKVIASFIWARPVHGDLPLWNAAQVRGKIVGMRRGPDTGTPASYGLKLHYAQQAGALAVIFVNSDPTAELYDMLPQIKEGAVAFGYVRTHNTCTCTYTCIYTHRM